MTYIICVIHQRLLPTVRAMQLGGKKWQVFENQKEEYKIWHSCLSALSESQERHFWSGAHLLRVAGVGTSSKLCYLFLELSRERCIRVYLWVSVYARVCFISSRCNSHAEIRPLCPWLPQSSEICPSWTTLWGINIWGKHSFKSSFWYRGQRRS